MNLASLLAAPSLTTLLLLASVLAKDEIDNDISKPESFSSSTAPNNLDANLRKALLRALTELENEDLSIRKTGEDDDEGSKTVFFSTRINTPERIVEKASASAFSILTNQQTGETREEFRDSDEEGKTQKPIVIIQKSAGVQHRPIISVLNEPHDEALSLSASSSFTENNNNFVRSSPKANLNLNSVAVNDKSFTPGVKSVSITPKYDVTTATTTTTSTEENEAKVEDVQFFPAPLVAAFTVHQDERGLPNKVEPIFKQAGQTAVSSTEVEAKQRQEVLRQEEIKINHYREQLAIQAKQKALEEQVLTLQAQQKNQQEYLLRQQRIIQEQQLQHQRLLEEQQRLQSNDRPFVPVLNNFADPSTTQRPVFFTTSSGTSFNTFQSKLPDVSPTISNLHQFDANLQQTTQKPLISLPPNPPSAFQDLPHSTPSPIFNQNLHQNRFNNGNFGSNFNNLNKLKNNFQNTVVSLQTSLSLSPTDLLAGKLPLNAQILPVRNAIDFHQSPNPNTNIDLRPPLSQQQQVFPPVFQQFPNNFVQSLPNLRQGTRVFRQESGTGNFGLANFNNHNNHFNAFSGPHTNGQFSIQQSLEPPTRVFRSNGENFQQQAAKNVYQPQNVNQQLNTLLYHSGITRNVRQNDDLQLVSKILSYNLGRDNMYAGSRLNEQSILKH